MHKSKEFDEFLDMMGDLVLLEGWDKYDGGRKKKNFVINFENELKIII